MRCSRPYPGGFTLSQGAPDLLGFSAAELTRVPLFSPPLDSWVGLDSSSLSFYSRPLPGNCSLLFSGILDSLLSNVEVSTIRLLSVHKVIFLS